jgi:UDP-N-acetylglucosamine acyltransferase
MRRESEVAPRIHPTAIVERGAELARGVVIGPYSIVGPRVRIGAGTVLRAHVVVDGDTSIGQENVLWPFVTVGLVPQVKNKAKAATGGCVVIGDRNELREHVTVHAGTTRETHIGADGLFMVGSHVAHDARVGNSVALANGVQLAGFTEVGDYATLGGVAGLAQFVRVGESAFVAAGAMCERDVPPFVIVQGDRARVRALNKVGLRRRGVPEASIAALEAAFRALFVAKLPRAAALARVNATDPFVTELVRALEEPDRARSARRPRGS